MSTTCDCCVGVHVSTPRDVVNRPGLSRLDYRIGTHGSFLASMLARLSSHDHPSLADLTARDPDDAAIALLDGWATVADVLTFYQERIVNEGFLRTATERRSILELGRLVGWTLRPGVSATAYLAYTVDADPQDPAKDPDKDRLVTIPKGSQAQSVPDPGPLPPTTVGPVALPQTFETDEDLVARASWSRLLPRRRRPFFIESDDLATLASLTIEGISTNLKPDGRLVLEFANPGPVVVRIASITADPDTGLTTVRLLGTRTQALDELRQAVTTFVESFDAAGGLNATQQSLVDDVIADLKTTIASMASFDTIAIALRDAIDAVTESEILYRSRGYTKVAAWARDILDELEPLRAEATALARAPFEVPLADGAAHAPVDLVAADGKAEPPPLISPVLVGSLRKRPSIPPRNSRALARDPASVFGAGSAASFRLLTTLDRRLAPTLDRAIEAERGAPSALTSVSAMRVKCQPFGASASLRPVLDERGVVIGSEEWPLAGEAVFTITAPFGGEFGRPVVSLERPDRTDVATLSNHDPVNLGDAHTVVTVDGGGQDLSIALTAAGLDDIKFVIEGGQAAAPITVSIEGNEPFKVAIPVDARARRNVGSHRYDISHRSVGDGKDSVLSIVARMPLRPDPLDVIDLDAEYEGIVPNSWVVIEGRSVVPFVASVVDVRSISRTDYGLTAKVTRITLSMNWLDANRDRLLSDIRGATVYVVSDPLTLALEPFDDDICGSTIELQRVYAGLETGRWIIVEGERTDVPVPAVRAAELAMIASVAVWRDPDRATDTPHTLLALATPLAYCYRRATATIYGNVAKASHGETRTEVLGSGDASRPLQAFSLRARPLTYLPDSNPLGAASTLELRVDAVRWSEAESLLDLGPKDHGFILSTDDGDVTTATTGTGRNGARLPTGPENVQAVYRNGTGLAGNVGAARISQLMSRPVGVSAVVNPLPATGGADRESLEQGRRNLPLGVLSLDRLVSVQDYEDFARARAGIGQASAVSLSDGFRRVVHLTVAGAADAPIDPSSDLFRMLRSSLGAAGDPAVPVMVAVRELALLVIAADVRIAADRRWDLMEPTIRAALLDAFSFDRRRLGQDCFLSEVQSAIQAVPGVVYSDVNGLMTVTESVTPEELRGLATRVTLPASGRVPVALARPADTTVQADASASLSSIAAEHGVDLETVVRLNPDLVGKPLTTGTKVTIGRGIRPAQIALLSPAVRDTLILRNLPTRNGPR